MPSKLVSSRLIIDNKFSIPAPVLQEIGTITKLYDLNNALICSFNAILPSLTINDQINNDYSFTLFIKNYSEFWR